MFPVLIKIFPDLIRVKLDFRCHPFQYGHHIMSKLIMKWMSGNQLVKNLRISRRNPFFGGFLAVTSICLKMFCGIRYSEFLITDSLRNSDWNSCIIYYVAANLCSLHEIAGTVHCSDNPCRIYETIFGCICDTGRLWGSVSYSRTN